MQKGFGMWSIRQSCVTMGKRGSFGAFFCTWKLCLFWNFLLRCPLAPTAFFVGLNRLFCFRQPFSHLQLPPLRPRGLILFQTTFFSRPAAALRPRCHFVPSRPTASFSQTSEPSVPDNLFSRPTEQPPFSRTSEPYSVPDNLFPVLLQPLFFSGPSRKLSPGPPPVIYDALWPRCTRWRAEPSSAAPWESIYR